MWLMASFSRDWLRDAYAESQREGPDHRRREVLFSVCLVESYLLESRSAFGGRGIDSWAASVIYGRHALETINRE